MSTLWANGDRGLTLLAPGRGSCSLCLDIFGYNYFFISSFFLSFRDFSLKFIWKHYIKKIILTIIIIFLIFIFVDRWGDYTQEIIRIFVRAFTQRNSSDYDNSRRLVSN